MELEEHRVAEDQPLRQRVEVPRQLVKVIGSVGHLDGRRDDDPVLVEVHPPIAGRLPVLSPFLVGRPFDVHLPDARDQVEDGQDECRPHDAGH